MSDTTSRNSMTLAQRLVRWQLAHGRHDLPWQNTDDAYRIWLSEIMLQQTQVATAVDYYQRFLTRFPNVFALANAELDEVLTLWAGLGYYSRARNLHHCAQTVVCEYGGIFPNTPEQLQQLSGIGTSTAAAIAVFAYRHRAPILDGNVKRILSRVFGVDEPQNAKIEQKLWQLAHQALVNDDDAHVLGISFERALVAYTQGVMDLGATVCKRSKPDCPVCPWQPLCIAHRDGRTAEIPARRIRPTAVVVEIVWWVYWRENQVWLEQRPSRGIWANLWEPPQIARLKGAAVDKNTQSLPTRIHRLTHRELRITPMVVKVNTHQAHRLSNQLSEGMWLSLIEQPISLALPKAVARLLDELRNITIE